MLLYLEERLIPIAYYEEEVYYLFFVSQTFSREFIVLY
jgi:hypothetical protein